MYVSVVMYVTLCIHIYIYAISIFFPFVLSLSSNTFSVQIFIYKIFRIKGEKGGEKRPRPK